MTSLILLAVLMASTHGAFLIINSKRYCQGKIKNVEDVAKIAFGNKGKVRRKNKHSYFVFFSFSKNRA